jgi:hypothetical protein
VKLHAKPSPPKGRSPSFPITHHGHSTTSISTPSAISSSAASANSSSFAKLQLASNARNYLAVVTLAAIVHGRCPHRLKHRGRQGAPMKPFSAYFRTNFPSRFWRGAPQLRQANCRSCDGGASTRTNLYRASHVGHWNIAAFGMAGFIPRQTGPANRERCVKRLQVVPMSDVFLVSSWRP